MILTGKRILLISPEEWGSNFVSKHHYAVTLANQGNRVFFLNPPTDRFSIEPTEYSGVRILNYTPFLKGLRYLPDSIQRYMIAKKFQLLQQLAECKFDIIWSFDNSVFYNFSALPDEMLKISHIVDLNQDFQTAIASRTADICFCTTDFIKEKLSLYNTHTFKIHHGYTLNNIEQEEITLPGNNAIKAVYVGNLSLKYIDWGTTYKIVEQNPSVDFIFIGPEGKSNLSKDNTYAIEINKVKVLGNTFFIGAIPSSIVHTYLEVADILLLIYKADEYKEQLASPHKMLEYLGSGKVILASYTEEYKDKQNLLAMTIHNQDMVSKFSEVVNNLSYYNSPEKQKERESYALDNTYNRQIEKIESLINYHVYQNSVGISHHASI